jgi:hypothetical protein
MAEFMIKIREKQTKIADRFLQNQNLLYLCKKNCEVRLRLSNTNNYLIAFDLH